MKRIAFFLTLLFFSVVSQAVDKYDLVDNCAQSQILKGDSCSNVEVEFTFEGCAEKFAPVVVKKVLCTKETVVARTTQGDYRFESRFLKQDDGWGSVSWQPKGAVKSWKRKSQPAPRPHVVSNAAPVEQKEKIETPKESAPVAAVAVTAAPPAPALSGSFKLSAYFDFRDVSYESKDPSVKTAESSGFLLEEGALALAYTDGPLSALADLPLARNDSTGTNDADLTFLKKKAQLFARYEIIPGLTFTFGQFDTFFGVEVNDSKDRVFGYTGQVYNLTLPVVHSGSYLEYTNSGFTGRVMYANPSDRDTLGSDPSDSSHETGVSIGFANDMFRAQAGYLARRVSAADGTGALRSLLDLIAGTTLGKFNLDLEYAQVDNPAKNTLTADPLDHETPGYGGLALASYQLTEKLKLGLRYEQIRNDPSGAGGTSATARPNSQSYSANLHYQLHPHLAARLEGVQIDTDPNAASNLSEKRFYIGGLFTL